MPNGLSLKKIWRLSVLVESATLCKRFPNCYGGGSESLDPVRAISAAVTQIKKNIKFASGAHQPGRHCKQARLLDKKEKTLLNPQFFIVMQYTVWRIGSWFLPIPDPGSRISDPGSKNSNKRQRWKKICYHTFLVVTNFTKLNIYVIFEMLKEKIWANFQRIVEVFTPKIFNMLSNIWVWDPGSGKNLIRIPDPGSRGQKGTGSRIPDPDPQHWQYILKRNYMYIVYCIIIVRLNIKLSGPNLSTTNIFDNITFRYRYRHSYHCCLSSF